MNRFIKSFYKILSIYVFIMIAGVYILGNPLLKYIQLIFSANYFISEIVMISFLKKVKLLKYLSIISVVTAIGADVFIVHLLRLAIEHKLIEIELILINISALLVLLLRMKYFIRLRKEKNAL